MVLVMSPSWFTDSEELQTLTKTAVIFTRIKQWDESSWSCHVSCCLLPLSSSTSWNWFTNSDNSGQGVSWSRSQFFVRSFLLKILFLTCWFCLWLRNYLPLNHWKSWKCKCCVEGVVFVIISAWRYICDGCDWLLLTWTRVINLFQRDIHSLSWYKTQSRDDQCSEWYNSRQILVNQSLIIRLQFLNVWHLGTLGVQIILAENINLIQFPAVMSYLNSRTHFSMVLSLSVSRNL